MKTLTSAVWTVGWGFTTRCDLACPFCYSARVRGARAQEAELSQAERFLAANGALIRALNFGTGESFLAPTFPCLLELCRRYAPQAAIAVTTNGALADLPAALRAEVGTHLRELDVSLDFAEPELHNRWRGKPGTWERALRAIEIALALGLETSIVMVGTPQTLTAENLAGLLEIAARYGVAFRVNLYMPTFGERAFIPTWDAVWLLLRMLRAWGSALRASDRLLAALLGCAAPHPPLRYACRILPDGKVSPSTYLLHAPWALDTTLPEIALATLSETPSFKQYAAPPLPETCAGCNFAAQCGGGSVERRWLWGHADLYAPDPLCPLLQPDTARNLAALAAPPGDWAGPEIHLDYLPTIVALPPNI